MHLVLLPHAGGVNQAHRLALPLDVYIYGIAGCAGNAGDDRAVLPREAVCKRGFAYVGAANDGNGYHVVFFLGRLPLREKGHELIKEVSRAIAMASGDGMGLAYTQRKILPDSQLVVGIIHLVDDEQNGLVRATDYARDFLVLIGHAHSPVHDKHDRIRLFTGDYCLLAYGRRKRILAALRLNATCVHKNELMA